MYIVLENTNISIRLFEVCISKPERVKNCLTFLLHKIVFSAAFKNHDFLSISEHEVDFGTHAV